MSFVAGLGEWRWARHAALGFVLVASVMAVGGGLPIIAIPVAMASALVLLLTGTQVRKLGPWLTTALLGLYSLLQAMPMPLTVLERVSPQAADVWARSLYPIGATVTTGSLSLDPGASRTEACKWLGYACTFLVASQLSKRRGLSATLSVVMLSGLALAVVTLGHALVESEKLFGFYEPLSSYPTTHMSPLLNSNNLAGYLNLSALIGLGLCLSARDPKRRWLLALSAIVLVAVSLRTASRGGALSLGLGVACFAGMLLVGARHDQRIARIGALALFAVVGLGVALSILGADHRFWTELLSENRIKLSLAKWAVPLIEEYRWLGVGRGAFESVFFAYRPSQPLHVVFTHPENVLVQWLSEWGAIVTFVAAAAYLVHLSPRSLRASRSPTRYGAWVGLLALLVHNMVDLSLELSGVSTAAFATFGALWGAAHGPSGDRPRPNRGERVARLGVWALALTTLALGAVCLSFGPTSVEQDRAAIRAGLGSEGIPANAQAFRDQLRANLVRHPADPYFPLAGAVAALSTNGKEDPMPWLQRALERGPTVARTHLALAESLRRRGARGQAMLELRLAAEYEPGLAKRVAASAIRMSTDPKMLGQVVPENDTAVLGALAAEASTLGLEELREGFDRVVLEREPTNWAAHRRAAEARFAALDTLTFPCVDYPSCEYELLLHIDALDRLNPGSALAPALRARLALWWGDDALAAAILDSGCRRPEGRGDCLEQQVVVLGKLKQEDALDAALKSLAAEQCRTPRNCAEVHERIASLRTGRGQLRLAVASLERAAREEPTVSRYVALADLAERASMSQVAVNALQQAAKLSGDRDAFADRIRRNRRQSAEESP